MYYRRGEDIIGVLNDYDLSRLLPNPNKAGPSDIQPLGRQRTGTLPFMALELLTDKGYAGEIEHRYRHDWESFIWVFIWIVCRYDDGRRLSNPPFDSWVDGDHTTCREKKADLRPSDLRLTTSFNGFSMYARHILGAVRALDSQVQRGDAQQSNASEKDQAIKVQSNAFDEPSMPQLMDEAQCSSLLLDGVAKWWT
jgi:Fungal protein kinase